MRLILQVGILLSLMFTRLSVMRMREVGILSWVVIWLWFMRCRGSFVVLCLMVVMFMSSLLMVVRCLRWVGMFMALW